MTQIERNGAAISKPNPGATLFVPMTGGGERSFGDKQLLAILPYVDDINRFSGISVRGSSVSDASIAELANTSSLQTLDVGDTAVTVAGLIQLRSLPNLSQITVSPGQLNAADRDRLRRAMPRVRIMEWAYPAASSPATRTTV